MIKSRFRHILTMVNLKHIDCSMLSEFLHNIKCIITYLNIPFQGLLLNSTQ